MSLLDQASTHHDEVQYGDNSRQCIARAMAAVAYHQVNNVRQWNICDFNSISAIGDKLYSETFKLQNVTFLLPNDSVNLICIGCHNVHIKRYQSCSGVLNCGFETREDLVCALGEIPQACILTFGQVMSFYSVAIMKEDDAVFVFDSLMNGCVTRHSNVSEIIVFVESMIQSFGVANECLFEVVNVEAYAELANEYVNNIRNVDCEEDNIPLISLLSQNTKITNMPAVQFPAANSDDDSDYDVPLATIRGKNVNGDGKSHLVDRDSDNCRAAFAKASNSRDVQDGTLDFDLHEDLILYANVYEEQVHCLYTSSGANDILEQDLDYSNISLNISSSSHDLGNSAMTSPTPQHAIKRLSRKRTRNIDEWKVNTRKRLRNAGQEYENNKGKKKRHREMKPGCGVSCRNKCHKLITPEERYTIFHDFWKMGCLLRQREYICQVAHKEQKQRITNARKDLSQTYRYYLRIGETNVPVCKKMFLDTLDISERIVMTALSKKNDLGTCNVERRGLHAQRGMPTEKEEIKRHIDSFPRLESHYARKDSKREYLESYLSLQKMYDLYVAKRTMDGCKNIASESTYRSVFNSQFNIGFHRRMKDRCDVCAGHENTQNDSEEYKEHLSLKEESRLFKARVKESLKGNPSKAAAVFDLEEVLPRPSSCESCLYYKRKLNTYNLTVFDYRDGQGYCYVWSEVDGQRGSNEIASCIFSYLKCLKEQGVKDVVLFSDSCGGQNRNKNFLSMLWLALRELKFRTIEHVFFVSGHSQNEGDSMHSTIERCSRNVPVYIPMQWAQLMRTAKRKKPMYIVEEFTTVNFFDFKKVATILKNFELDSEKDKIKWLKVRRFELSASEPNSVKVYYDYSENYRTLNLLQKMRVVHQIADATQIKLENVSKKAYPLNKDKYTDLIQLCNNNIIPQAHHEFFKNLPHEVD